MKLNVLVTGRADEGITCSLREAIKGDPRFNSGREVLLIAGDTYAACLAAVEATRARTPIVHLHGGEVTEGCSDDQYRNAITKMAHLHLVSHVLHGARVVAMGEDPATVHVVGAPGLDHQHRKDLPRVRVESMWPYLPDAPTVLVTLHPATLGEDAGLLAQAVRDSMRRVRANYIVSASNNDPGFAHLASWYAGPVAKAFGAAEYWSWMKSADAMLGNSSSGLIEAPAVQLPVVNVGDRQKGRLRGANVIDVWPEAGAVTAALRQALSPEFRASLKGTSSPYGDGHSAERIVNILANWTPPDPPRKRAAC